MKTIEEIADLKSQWSSDPHWDIEETDGFEAHYNELLAYRRQKELEWLQKAEQEVRDKAAFIGCPDNLQLARYVISLEDQIARLEERLEKLENA